MVVTYQYFTVSISSIFGPTTLWCKLNLARYLTFLGSSHWVVFVMWFMK